MIAYVRRRRALIATSMLVLLTLFTAACGRVGVSTPPDSSLLGPIQATLSEWKIDLSTTRVASGDVMFAITNSGATDHEFLVIRTDTSADSLPVKNNVIDVQALGGSLASSAMSGAMASGGMNMPGMSPRADMEHPAGTVGVVPDVPPGAATQLTVAGLEAGHYVIVCDLPGHYEQAMRIDFTVG